MRKFYFDELYGSVPTDTFTKIDKMFDEMFKPAIDNMKGGDVKVVVIDSLADLSEILERDAIKTHEEQQKNEHKCDCDCNCKCKNDKVDKHERTTICLDIQSITSNHEKGVFTVVWEDGTHTMITLQPGDTWDDEKALAMCMIKHIMGDTGSFNDIFTQELPEKMRVIPKKAEPVKADTPTEDTSHAVTDAVDSTKYGEDSLKKLGETSAEAAKAIADMEKSMKELVDFITGDTVEMPTYEAYIKLCTGKKYRITHPIDKKSLAKLLRDHVKKNFPSCVGTPWRLWNSEDGMYIDFGLSDYFLIPNMTTAEWLGI